MSDELIKYSSEKKGLISGSALPEDLESDILSLRPERLV